MEELSPVDKFYIWHAAELKDLEENGPRVRRGRKPTKKQYFTYITDQAIIAYNFEPSWSKRNKVFSEFINYPFNKLNVQRTKNVAHGDYTTNICMICLTFACDCLVYFKSVNSFDKLWKFSIPAPSIPDWWSFYFLNG